MTNRDQCSILRFSDDDSFGDRYIVTLAEKKKRKKKKNEESAKWRLCANEPFRREANEVQCLVRWRKKKIKDL